MCRLTVARSCYDSLTDYVYLHPDTHSPVRWCCYDSITDYVYLHLVGGGSNDSIVMIPLRIIYVYTTSTERLTVATVMIPLRIMYIYTR